MISSFAADGFKLPARFLGLLHLEERDRQGKARPEGELRIKLEGGAEFGGGHFVSIVSQGVVGSTQMSIRRVRGWCLCGRRFLRCRGCGAGGDERQREQNSQNPRH